ncbi:MAG: A24 family peptidase [Hyphomicrobium sp.]
MVEYPLLLVFPMAMIFAGAFDLLTMTIPNRISMALLGAFFVIAPLVGMPVDVMLRHMALGAAVLAVGIAFFAMRWMGGGDVKLLAVASLWIGLDNFVMYLAQVAVLGGVLAIAILAFRWMPVAALPLPEWALRLHRQGTGIPYGLAIAGAALMIYPKTGWFTAFAT